MVIRTLLAAGVLLALGHPAGADHCELHFVDRAAEAGVLNPSFGRGSAMVDVDGDGLLDLINANAEMPNGFFRQLDDHTFVNATFLWGIAWDVRSTWGVLAADFDNDGDPDIYFINGGFVGFGSPNQILRNDLGNAGVFTDLSSQSGDAPGDDLNFGGTVLDFDRDGDLDIFLTTTDDEPCRLLRNDGNFFFRDVSLQAGISIPGSYRHCSAGDLDNDGWIDLAVGGFNSSRQITQVNLLFRNNGDGTFSEIAAAAGVESPGPNFGLVFEDFDNDGWMDLYVPKWNRLPADPSELYLNNGDGTFRNVTSGSGMSSQADMGHTTGDFNGDGYPDIYIGTGMPSQALEDRLFLVTPDGAGGLVASDASESCGILSIGLTRCHGMAVGDYDRDGDIDIYANNGGVPDGPAGSLQENALWQNQGNGHNWVALHLTGTTSNRDAVGARCVALTSTGREVHTMVRIGNGFANTDSPIQHFGISTEQRVVRIDVTWPSGDTQSIIDPPMHQVHDMIEGENPHGDVDGNGWVGIDDLVAVVLAWGTCPDKPFPCPADVDGDGHIGIDDLIEVILQFG